MELSYYMCVFLVATPFSWYQKNWPCDLDLDFDLLFEKLELVAAGGISPVRTDPDLVSYVGIKEQEMTNRESKVSWIYFGWWPRENKVTRIISVVQ